MTQKKKSKKKGWSVMRILEIFVVLGSVAAVALKVFQGKKKKK